MNLNLNLQPVFYICKCRKSKILGSKCKYLGATIDGSVDGMTWLDDIVDKLML